MNYRCSSPSSDLHGIVKRLPTVLAMPITEFLEETHPVVGLWHICDIAELSLRMLVLIGIAEHGKRLPTALVRELGDRIERPTMGSWLGMAQALSTHIPSDSLAPELKESVEKLAAILGTQSTPPESGCLSLRNLLAHGGGMRRVAAEKYLTIWSPRIAEILKCLSWLMDCQIIGRDQSGQLRVLRGLEPQGEIVGEDLARTIPSPVDGGGDVLWLVRGSRALPLWPLGRYAAPGADAQSAEAAERFAQIYIRRGEVRLQYLNVGGDDAVSDSDSSALDSFLALFKVEEQSATVVEYSVRGFETEFRKEAKRLIGREQELAALRDACNQMRGGLLWFGGVAGMGKSCLIATAVVELLDTPPAGALVLVYRFRASDDRCFREAFIRFAVERLEPWDGLVPCEKELPETTRPIDRLKDCLARVKVGRRVLFMVDGLDEITERDAQFAQEVILTVASEKAGFICVGRPERGIPEAFRKAGAIEPFPDGLPPMLQADVRAMLVTRTEGQLRKRLVKRDKETGDSITNPFIERVSRLSEGLPLYINYVVGDILSGKIAPEAERQLPAGLHAYHEELLRRCAIGDLQSVVTPMVATLSVAYEPLTAGELAALLVRRGVMRDPDVALVGRALVALASMIRRAPNANGEEGYMLYHASLREHVLQSEGMRHTVGTTRTAMAEAAQKPAGDLVEKYLYRCGIRHLLDAGQKDDALHILTDFDYVMARLQRLGGGKDAVAGYYRDWDAVGAAAPSAKKIDIWRDFLSVNRHLLLSGNDKWGSHKILLQAAIEHADDSPVTKAAETFLASGKCDWLWLRNVRRPKAYVRSGCVAVLAHHRCSIFGATELSEGRILTWSLDGIPCVWNLTDGAIFTLKGHTAPTNGASELRDNRVLTWSVDNTLRIWDSKTGVCCAVLSGHGESCDEHHGTAVNGATQLSTGQILSWASDGVLRLWSEDDGHCLNEFLGHTTRIAGVVEQTKERFVSWSQDGTLRAWNSTTGKCLAVFKGHTQAVAGAMVLPNEHILSWSADGTLRIWNEVDGQCMTVLQSDNACINGALALSNSRVVSWSVDGILRVWNTFDGTCSAVLIGHSAAINGALLLSDGKLLSWSDDKHLRVWDAITGQCVSVLPKHTHAVSEVCEFSPGLVLARSYEESALLLWDLEQDACPRFLQGHNAGITGIRRLSGGRILTWSLDRTVRVWQLTPDIPACNSPREGVDTRGAVKSSNCRIASWSDDYLIRVWDSNTGERLCSLGGHSDLICGLLTLPSARILSWSRDCTIRVWDIDQQACIHVLRGHDKSVLGALSLSNGHILSWSADNTLRTWDASDGECFLTLRGHSDGICGARELTCGHVVSWSRDRTLRIWDMTLGKCVGMVPHNLDFNIGHGSKPDGHISARWIPNNAGGYSDIVSGVVEVSTNRIISFGRAMRLVDIEAGKCINAVRSPSLAFEGVATVSPDRLVFWAKPQSGYLLFTCDSQLSSREGPWSQSELRKRDPSAWWAFIQTILVCCKDWALDPVTGFIFNKQQGLVGYCFADKRGISHGHILSDDGLVVVSSREALGFLHLMHGSRQVCLDDATPLVSNSIHREDLVRETSPCSLDPQS